MIRNFLLWSCLSLVKGGKEVSLADTAPAAVVRYWLKCQIQPIINANESYHLPQLKPVFQHTKPVFIGLYALLGLGCFCINGLFLYKARSQRVLHSFVFKYLALLSVSNLLSGTVGSSVTLLIHMTFWNYGGFLCYTMPVVQEFLTYVTFLSLFFVVIECYRLVVKLEDSPLTFVGCAATIIILSLCLALPNLIFTNYYSMKDLALEFCQVGSEQMEEYARAMFVLSYALPVLAMALFLIKISLELKVQEDNCEATPMSATSAKSENARLRRCDSAISQASMHQDAFTMATENPVANIRIQKLTVKYLSFITGLTAAFWLPLNITLLVQLGFEGGDCAQLGKHDLAYSVLVWIAFLHTVATPSFSLFLMRERELGLMEYMSIQFYGEQMKNRVLMGK